MTLEVILGAGGLIHATAQQGKSKRFQKFQGTRHDEFKAQRCVAVQKQKGDKTDL